jgi:hypothetical protein
MKGYCFSSDYGMMCGVCLLIFPVFLSLQRFSKPLVKPLIPNPYPNPKPKPKKVLFCKGSWFVPLTLTLRRRTLRWHAPLQPRPEQEGFG